MIVAPHPDDETIGCGGALALHARARDPVRVVVLTNGAKGDMGGRFERNIYIRMRQQETLAACTCLGISDVLFWDYEDRELAAAENVVSDLIALINTYRPELIYAPSPLEFHPDHRAASEFTQKAVRLCIAETELLFYEVGQPLQVDILVDITGVLDKKKQAIQQYRSQLEERPYDDVALSLNRFRRLTLPEDVTHAEGFVRYCYRPILSITGDTTMRTGESVDALLSIDIRYSVAVIVRTQGVRLELLMETLTSISRQSGPCLAVVVVHAEKQMLQRVESTCRQIPSLFWIIIHAERTENKRGYPLNVGLQYIMTCPYKIDAVAFLDDDDIWYPEFSGRMSQTMRETGADVICAASNRCVPGEAPEEGYKPVLLFNIFSYNFVPINSYIIRFETLIKTPVFFDETMDVVEDWHFLLQLIQHDFRFVAIMDVLSEFRIISDGNKQIKDDLNKWKKAHQYVQAFIRDNSFVINGEMLRSWVTEMNLKAAGNQ